MSEFIYQHNHSISMRAKDTLAYKSSAAILQEDRACNASSVCQANLTHPFREVFIISRVTSTDTLNDKRSC